MCSAVNNAHMKTQINMPDVYSAMLRLKRKKVCTIYDTVAKLLTTSYEKN